MGCPDWVIDMSIDAALLLGLIALVMASLFYGQNALATRLQWLFVMLAATSSALSVVDRLDFTQTTTIQTTLLGAVSLPWWILGLCVLFGLSLIRGERVLVSNAQLLIATSLFIMSAAIFYWLPLVYQGWIKCGLWFLVGIVLTVVRKKIVGIQLSSPRSYRRLYSLLLVIMIGSALLIMLRHIYTMRTPSASITLSDELLNILILLLALSLPVYESIEAHEKLSLHNEKLVEDLVAIRESVGLLIAEGSGFEPSAQLGLVVTDEELIIRYQNATAKALFNDGNNLLRGVRLCKVLTRLDKIDATHLSRQGYVLVEPLVHAERSMVEIKSITLPRALHQKVKAFSLRRVIADPPVLDFWVNQLGAYSHSPIWVCDQGGVILHASTNHSQAPSVDIGGVGNNVFEMVKLSVPHDQLLDHVKAQLMGGMDASLRVAHEHPDKECLVHFLALFVGRPERRRFAVYAEVIAKAPPFLVNSRVNAANIDAELK